MHNIADFVTFEFSVHTKVLAHRRHIPPTAARAQRAPRHRVSSQLFFLLFARHSPCHAMHRIPVRDELIGEAVARQGGYEAVEQSKKWEAIANGLGLAKSLGEGLKKRYEDMLRTSAELDEVEDEDEEFEVEAILDSRTDERGNVQYLVKWKFEDDGEEGDDADEKDNTTWEPRDNLACPELLERFDEEKRAKEKKKQKQQPLPAEGDGMAVDGGATGSAPAAGESAAAGDAATGGGAAGDASGSGGSSAAADDADGPARKRMRADAAGGGAASSVFSKVRNLPTSPSHAGLHSPSLSCVPPPPAPQGESSMQAAGGQAAHLRGQPPRRLVDSRARDQAAARGPYSPH